MATPSSPREPPSKPLPYGRHWIDDDDVKAVADVLRSEWLTTGPKVAEFEQAFAGKVGATFAVAVNSGTAALHAAAFSMDIGPGDEVIVPPITFAATANCVVFQGATPVFADIESDTLLIDPRRVEQKITKKTKALITVDYAGCPCDYDALRALARKHKLAFVSDACHALGAAYKGRPVGALADLNTFSFHPVKHITTGEGGMVTTDDERLATRMRDFRTHGITRDAARFGPPICEHGAWYYEMQELGYNYRMPDINAALGLSQLKKLDRFVARRRRIAARYDEAFRGLSPVLRPVSSETQVSGLRSQVSSHAYHLYVVQIDFPGIGKTRGEIVQALKDRGVGTQVHYVPVHLQPFYRARFGYGAGLCPVAEAAYGRLLSLPLYPAMSDEDVEQVIAGVRKVL